MATMTVKRVKDIRHKKVFMHKVADIRGGVGIKTSELGGDYIPEGAVLSAPEQGLCHVVKVAKLAASYTGDTTLKVEKYSCFKVGDQVMTKTSGKAYAITAIDYSNAKYDVLTIGTAIDNADQGAYVVEAKAQSTNNTSKLKYEPFAVNGTAQDFKQGDNVSTDAWLIGVTKGNPLPSFVADKLKGIINY